MWVTEETPLPLTNVPFSATEANKFGEAACAVGVTSAAAVASAIPNNRFCMVKVFIMILLQRNRDLIFPKSEFASPGAKWVNVDAQTTRISATHFSVWVRRLNRRLVAKEQVSSLCQNYVPRLSAVIGLF